MKKTRSFSPSFVIVFVLLCLQACRSGIDITQYSEPEYAGKTIEVKQDVKFSISLIETGYAKTLEAFVYRGGSYFRTRKLSHVAILIQHPKGNFLFDTGLGSKLEKQFHEEFSFMERQMFKYHKTQTVQESLGEYAFDLSSIDFIIPSHLHFDHASGIEDFPSPQVWVTKEEYVHAMGDEAVLPAFIKDQYDADQIQWSLIDFNSGPYEVFEQSYDVFKDGTVVLVKLPGHTSGSVGMFVNLNSGKRYFFMGDLTWATEAILSPAEKFSIPRKIVDENREKVKEAIMKVYYLHKNNPNIQLVPAHDFKAQMNIARFPEVEF